MDAIDSSMWLDPPTAQSRGRRGWWGGGAGGAKKKQRSAKEIRFRRRSRYAVLIAIGAVLSYLLTGEVLVLAFGDGDGDGDEDGDGDGEETGTETETEEVELEESLDDDDDELEPPRTTSSAPSFSSSPDRYAKGTYPVLVLLHRSIDDVVAVRPRLSSGLHKSCSPHLFSVTSKVSSSFSQILA